MAPNRRAVGVATNRSLLIAIGLAAGLLALPLIGARSRNFAGLQFVALEPLILAGVAIGWIAADRLAARRIAPLLIVALIGALAIVIWVTSRLVVFPERGGGLTAVTVLVAGMAGGVLVRGTAPDRRSPASLVAIAAMTLWLMYDLTRVPFGPLRDLQLYLNAGKAAAAGVTPYLQAPLDTLPDSNHLPFVYAPPTIPVLRVLAEFPLVVAEGIWIVVMLAAAVGALWLLGVRGRWLVVMLAWPPIAIGVSVGNVAIFLFLALAAGFWVGPLLIVGGYFKPQSAILAFWLVRERRWRAIAIGVGIVVALALVTLPFTGTRAWFDWAAALGQFQATTDQFPTLKALSLTHSVPLVIAVLAVAVAVGLALLGRGRNGLARLGLASIVASPTLYVHGLTALLPGALALRPELLWFVLGLGPWVGNGVSAWLAVVIVFVSLIASRDDLPIPSDLSPGEADIHPGGRTRRVWPERGDAPGISAGSWPEGRSR